MEIKSGMAKIRRGTWLTGAGLLGLGMLGLAWRLGSPGLAQGGPLGWKTPQQKQAAADLLNATVRLKGFRASLHTVAPGENLWAIARGQKVNVDTLFGLNPELDSLKVRAKAVLLVANQRGSMHLVGAGETTEGIATAYGVKPEELKKANRRGWLGLRPGQLIFVPGAKPRQLGPALQAMFDKRRLLRSPLAGRFSSLMGTREDPFTGTTTHHNGVDIKAPYNEPVGAAAAGRVVFAGWNGGYGKCVKIDHGNGYLTLYGHLNGILVHTGQAVRQHQFIGKVGSSGKATGPHLHFTVYYEGKVKNPLEFLW